METTPTHDPLILTGQPGSNGGGSMLDRVRARRQEANDQTIDMVIPGWGDLELTARYRLLDPLVEGKAIGRAVRKKYKDEEEQMFWARINTLIEACEGIYGRNENGDLVPVSVNGSGEPARYGTALGEALGIEAADARDVVIGLFRDNKVAANTHGIRLQAWMADPEGEMGLGGI